jgi:hypothetical protein
MERTIYDICMSYTDKQEVFIDPFFKETPLFNTMKCIEASKGATNVFEKIKEVQIPELVDYDAPLPLVSASTELGYAKIGKVGGRINLPLDQCKLLGKEAILAKQLPPILNRTGQAFDFSFMYSSLKAHCVANSTDCVTKIGTAGSNFYSMVGITWGEGENCGLYQPKLSGKKMFDFYAIGGGNIIDLKDKDGKTFAGYAMELAMYLGIQIPRNDRIHLLANCNSSNVPSYEQLLNFVDDFDGYDPANSAIYCHPKMRNILSATFQKDTGHADLITVDNTGLMRISGCPVIVDKNMLKGTEEIFS